MTRDYGNYCGLSHALDLVGSRWTLLIVRELLTGSKRFTDLEQGLPGIPTNILSARLRELEESGLVERRLLPRPASGVVYALTDYGRELEDPLLRLGMWGAKSLDMPKAGQFVSCSSLALGLRAMFRSEQAGNARLTFEIPIGERVVRGSIRDGRLTVPDDSFDESELTIHADPAVIAAIFRGTDTVDEALAGGRLQLSGSRDDADRFFAMFHMPTQSLTAQAMMI